MSKRAQRSVICDGVWPTMITPFAVDGQPDYAGLEQLVEWYISQGVHGLFAVCQSSEMFRLSLDERVQIARFVREQAGGRVPVIASGHISEDSKDQIEEIKRISDTGIDAFVLVSNRLAEPEQSEEMWRIHAEAILNAIPDMMFGIYECPYPFKRVLSPDLLRWCADTGRFKFLKDTSCDLQLIQAKLDAVRGSGLKLFNANSATLLESLRMGASGFSGVMANFHPQLYTRLIERQGDPSFDAERLQSFLGLASVIERQCYPINAKYHMQLEGLPIGLHSRVADARLFTASMKLEVEQLRVMGQWMKAWIDRN